MDPATRAFGPAVASMGPWLCSHGNRRIRSWAFPLLTASMGPWLCSHGNMPTVARAASGESGFNGAVAV